MVNWREEEWCMKQIKKLEKAVADQKHRKIVRILDRIMDEYDVEEHEIWPLLASVPDGKEEQEPE